MYYGTIWAHAHKYFFFMHKFSLILFSSTIVFIVFVIQKLKWSFCCCCLLQHNTMESLLERGEKLDDLVQKSEHLGNQSKAFYKTVSTLTLSSVPVNTSVVDMINSCLFTSFSFFWQKMLPQTISILVNIELNWSFTIQVSMYDLLL